MEDFKEFFKIIIGLFLVTFLSFKILEFLSAPPSISVGDIWMDISTQKDPFKKGKYRCYKVLEVKHGYVKYLYLPNVCTSSTEISIFTYNSKKIR